MPAFTDNVDEPPAVTEVGFNDADAPNGTPDTDKLTFCADPLVTAVEIVELPLPPTGTVKLDGVALIEKSLRTEDEIVSVTVVECVALVPVPVTVNVYVPAAAVPAFTDNVDEPPAVTEVGFNDAVAPDGTPDTDRLTVCADPLVTAVEIVEVPPAPGANVKLDGFALIEKSFGGADVTVRLTVVECVALVPVPVTVNVYVPAAAVPAFTVKVDEPPANTEDGFNDAVAPNGTPDTDKLTVCADPLVTAVEIVEPPLTP